MTATNLGGTVTSSDGAGVEAERHMRVPRPAREGRLTDWEAIRRRAQLEVEHMRAEPDTDMWAAVKAGTWPCQPKEVKTDE